MRAVSRWLDHEIYWLVFIIAVLPSAMKPVALLIAEATILVDFMSFLFTMTRQACENNNQNNCRAFNQRPSN
jgi:hypothetical protein